MSVRRSQSTLETQSPVRLTKKEQRPESKYQEEAISQKLTQRVTVKATETTETTNKQAIMMENRALHTDQLIKLLAEVAMASTSCQVVKLVQQESEDLASILQQLEAKSAVSITSQVTRPVNSDLKTSWKLGHTTRCR